jgi:hypothetical protein
LCTVSQVTHQEKSDAETRLVHIAKNMSESLEPSIRLFTRRSVHVLHGWLTIRIELSVTKVLDETRFEERRRSETSDEHIHLCGFVDENGQSSISPRSVECVSLVSHELNSISLDC